MSSDTLTKIVGTAVRLTDLDDNDIDAVVEDIWAHSATPCSIEEVQEAKRQLAELKEGLCTNG